MIPVAENSLQIESELMHKIIEFCDEHESIAGISNPYSKINYTKSCYEQAAKAIRLASILDIPGNVFEYRRLAFYDIVDHPRDLKRLSLAAIRHCHCCANMISKAAVSSMKRWKLILLAALIMHRRQRNCSCIGTL